MYWFHVGCLVSQTSVCRTFRTVTIKAFCAILKCANIYFCYMFNTQNECKCVMYTFQLFSARPSHENKNDFDFFFLINDFVNSSLHLDQVK